MNQNKTKKFKESIIKALHDFIEKQFSGNKAKAAEFLGETKMTLNKYLKGHRAGIEKLVDLLEKTKKYEVILKVKKR